jgi:hypothetical protein
MTAAADVTVATARRSAVAAAASLDSEITAR